MKKLYYINVVILLLTFEISAQYPLAPEVWSVPKKIAVISDTLGRAESPSISWDGKYLYFDWIGACEWSGTGWSVPYRLNNNINQHLASYPCISPNGKRLFFTWYVGGWYMYYSDWDSTINDWGPAINCGPNVNTPYVDGECVLPNDTTLIFLRSTETHISYWDSENQTWGPEERWPTPYLYFQSDWGVYVSPDFEKVYLEGARIDTTKEGRFYLNYDIIVCYRDTTNPMGYKPPKILNFCLYADTQYYAGNYVDRLEGYPNLTPDGKKMYLVATYDGQITIYESDMLIDENGDTVTNVENNNIEFPNSFYLNQNYPNPFNSTTNIRFYLPESDIVSLTVYDILGNEILKPINNRLTSAGWHEYQLNLNSSGGDRYEISSGVYIYKLKTSGSSLSNKMVYLK